MKLPIMNNHWKEETIMMYLKKTVNTLVVLTMMLFVFSSCLQPEDSKGSSSNSNFTLEGSGGN